MSRRFAAAFLTAGLLAVVAMAPASGAPAKGAASNGDAAAERGRYWTAERRDAAIPRDLVIDGQGNGYLRRPDGTLQPYGAEPSATDTSPSVFSNQDPAAGSTIGSSYTFKATVTDPNGVKAVSFNLYGTDHTASHTLTASRESRRSDVWVAAVQGLTAGAWEWTITAKDGTKRGGLTTTSTPVAFTVTTGDTGGGGTAPEPDIVENAEWSGGDVQWAAGRIYFEMPTNSSGTRWGGYVCSGTTAYDQETARSIIITAAHCVYDDAVKVFARNVLFIPNQDATTGGGTDTNCSNDPLGCWAPSHGVVDQNWTTRTWPNNIPWDYAYYVAPDSGYSGEGDKSLDGTVNELPIEFTTAPGLGVKTHALGYSYSDDPNFMYCAEGLARENSYGDWWLAHCGLSGGSSGGPWVQPMDTATGSGPIVSVNSWGYTDQPGMGGPPLHKTDRSDASCVFDWAKANVTNTTRGYVASCPQ